MVEVVFQGRRCTIELLRYRGGQPALVLHDARDGEDVAVATVNLPELPAGPDEVFIKDYSENAGMLAALEAAGIVEATGEFVESGSATIPRARLLPGFLTRIGILNGVGTDASHGEPAGTSPSDEPGVYQMWLNTRSPAERINSIFGGPPPPFPNGFRHVADVEAGSVRAAYRKAHSDGNLLDFADESGNDWQKNDGVRVFEPDLRSADFGDVIVSPDGQAHQLVNGGFRNIPRVELRPGFPARPGSSMEEHAPASPPAVSEESVYQVWINDNPPVERIYQMFGLRMPRVPNGFPNRFLHVADVVAGSVEQAYGKAHSKGNLLDPKDTTWKDWQKNDGVRVLLPEMRGADFGDVIVSPDGQAHQLIDGGFRNIPHMKTHAPHAGHRGTEAEPDAPSPSGIAAERAPGTPELTTGRTKGKKP